MQYKGLVGCSLEVSIAKSFGDVSIFEFLIIRAHYLPNAPSVVNFSV